MSNNPFSLGTYDVTPPTLTDGQTHQVELDVNANLKIASLPAGAAIIGQVEVTDGSNILGTPAHPVKTDPTGTTTQPVSGTVTATQATGTNLHVVVDSAPTTAVTGTVTANAGTGTFATSDAADGSTGSAVPVKAIQVAGSKSGTLQAVSLDSSGNLNVNVAAGGGSGGTSSSFGAAFPATGTAVGASDGTNMQGLQVESSTNKNLKVAVYNGTTEVAIKAASTAAAATDPAIVVQLNPIQPNLTTPLNVQDTADGPVTAGTAATTSTLTGGVAATSAPTPTAGQQIALQLDSNGNQRVSPYGHTGSIGNKSAAGAGVVGTTIRTLTVPAGKKWIVYCLFLSAVVANSGTPRVISANALNSSSVAVVSCAAGVNSPINATTNYTFGPGVPLSSAVTNNNVSIPFPQVAIGPGGSLNLFIQGTVVADSYTFAASVLELPD